MVEILPIEIYCLESLGQGNLEPAKSLIDMMNKKLDEYAKLKNLTGNFTVRAGTQFKLSSDELQYYIIRRYE